MFNKNFRIFLVVLIVQLLSFSKQYSQQFPPTIYTHSARQYKAHSQIFCAEYWHKYHKWVFGTGQEVLLFDGYNYTHILIGAGKNVFSLASPPGSDTLWVGAQSDFGFIAPDNNGILHFTSLLNKVPDSLRNFNIIWRTHYLPGVVVFNGYSYLYLYHIATDTVIVIRPEGKNFYLSHLLNDSVVWVQDIGKNIWQLIIQKDKVFQRGSYPSFYQWTKLKWKGKFVRNILPYAGGQLLITRMEGIYFHPLGSDTLLTWGETSIKELSKNYSFYCMQKVGEKYWIGTNTNGVYVFTKEGKVEAHIGRNDGLPNNDIWDITFSSKWGKKEDRVEGSVAIATDNGFCITPFSTAIRTLKEGENYGGGISGIARLSPGDSLKEMVLISTSQAVYRMDKKWAIQTIKGSEGQNNGITLLSKDKVLIAGGNEGLLLYKADMDAVEVVDKVHVYDIAVDSHRVLTGGRDGLCLYEYKGGKMIKKGGCLALKEEPGSVAWYDGIFSDSKDGAKYGKIRYGIAGLWTNGIAVVEVKDTLVKVHYYDTVQCHLPGGNINLFSTTSGLLAGTSRGLYKITIHSSQEKPVVKAIPFCKFGEILCEDSRQVFGLSEDKEGTMWIIRSGKEGQLIYHISKVGAAYCIDTTFSMALDIGAITSLCPDGKGGLYIGGDFGLAHYNPKSGENFLRPFNTVMNEVYLQITDTTGKSKDSLVWGGYGKLPFPILSYQYNHIKFTFVAPYYYHQDKILYRWKLEGFDEGWSEWQDKREVNYTNLPEGEYTFVVEAKNVYGVISKRAEFRFKVLPPWYRSGWAYAGYGVIGIGFVWLAMWLNSIRLRARARELEKEVKKATATIEQRNKALEQANIEITKQKEFVEEAHKKLSIAHKDIKDSIEYARRIQEAILPFENRIKEGLRGCEFFIAYYPRDVVAGDFYWFGVQGECSILAVCDCTGHGVPGAFMSMVASESLNQSVLVKGITYPGEVLSHVDRLIRVALKQDETHHRDGMDAALLCIDWEKKEVHFSGANRPLVYVREGEGTYSFVKGSKNSVGGFLEGGEGVRVYDTYAISIEEGGASLMVYLFSDGFQDQFGGIKEKKFGAKRFYELLYSIHDKSMEEQERILRESFEEWKGVNFQTDDVCVIGVRIRF